METQTWQTECLYAAIAFRIKKNNGLPTVDDEWSSKFATEHVMKMCGDELISIKEDKWQLTDKGRKFYKNVLAALDQAKKFEIFNQVWINHSPSEKESEDGAQVYNGVYDPRFLESRNSGTEPEDLRIALMTFVADCVADKVDTENFKIEKVIFLQKLLDEFDDGKDPDADFWFDLTSGKFFKQAEEIAKNAYQWQDLIGGDEDAAWEVASAVYTAGQLQQRKIDGLECSNCNAPLALQENEKQCEECNAEFGPPPEEDPEFECPRCNADIRKGQSICSCGADINFALTPGTVNQTEETIVTEEQEQDDDDFYYQPYGYYDPYSPVGDALAFGLVCCVLF